MTFESSIPASLLYNKDLLNHLLAYRVDGTAPAAVNEPFAETDCYEHYARREFQIRDGFHDNEVFQSRWGFFCQEHKREYKHQPSVDKNQGRLFLSALHALCKEYLEFSHGQLHVRLKQYAEWQNLMASINFHPIIAYAMQMEDWGEYRSTPIYPGLGSAEAEEDYRRWGNSLCYPYDTAVEDYIRQKGLNDAHMHINACAYAELSWLYAVCHPRKSYEEIISWGKSAPMRQQLLEILGNHPTATLEQHLQIAANIRSILRAHSAELPLSEECCYRGEALRLLVSGEFLNGSIGELCNVELSGNCHEPDWQQHSFPAIIHHERVWMARLIRDLRYAQHPDAVQWLALLLHVYILLMNEYCNLLIMKESQKGFNQFGNTQGIHKHLSWLGSYYYEIFRHFHGLEDDSIVYYLDARIAPKSSVKENVEQLAPILQSYLRYLDWAARMTLGAAYTPLSEEEFRQSPEGCIFSISRLTPLLRCRYLHLNLTAHFIKMHGQAWVDEDPYRYNSYQETLRGQVDALHTMLSESPTIGHYLCGIDAASDEQNIPPSALAPCFRACCRKLNIDNITFHCGEDFPHLLTGLRVLNDALTFFDMKRGDRIGHATALGIHPEYWVRHSPRTVCLRKEERMLDLLLGYTILKQSPGAFSPLLHHVHDELMELAHSMFGGYISSFNIYDLATAMRLRHLDPKYLTGLFGTELNLLSERIRTYKKSPDTYVPVHAMECDKTHSEYRMMQRYLEETPSRSIKLLLIWFTAKEVWERGQEYKRVEIQESYIEAYLCIQQRIMHEFRNKGVIIETLVTSNLRIACYHHAMEHHAMRWLHCKPAAVEGDPKLQLAFGSDDPGIFSCDAKSEFYLLYTCLRHQGLSEQEALATLHDVNRRGRVYSFANTNKPRAL